MLVSVPFITKVFQFVISTSQKYRIDESHGLLHSMNTLYYANAIFEDEVKYKPNIQSYERIIYVSAAIHDMCDKKYMNEDEGLSAIDRFLDGKMTNKEFNLSDKQLNLHLINKNHNLLCYDEKSVKEFIRLLKKRMHETDYLSFIEFEINKLAGSKLI